MFYLSLGIAWRLKMHWYLMLRYCKGHGCNKARAAIYFSCALKKKKYGYIYQILFRTVSVRICARSICKWVMLMVCNIHIMLNWRRKIWSFIAIWFYSLLCILLSLKWVRQAVHDDWSMLVRGYIVQGFTLANFD